MPGSFGGTYIVVPTLLPTQPVLDIGGALYGSWMRYIILGSIIVSQLGFVSAYTIFVAENLQVWFQLVPCVIQ